MDLKRIIDEIVLQKPLLLDLKVLRQYREELHLTKFLADLYTSLATQVRRHILDSETVLSLVVTIFRTQRAFHIVVDPLPQPTSENSALIVHGRDRRRGHGDDTGFHRRGFYGVPIGG